MNTSMKKVEVYSSRDECGKLEEFLDGERIYWYREEASLAGGSSVCKFTFYAPVQALARILDGIAGLLDLRRRENLVTVLDVETGLGRPYRVTSRRFLPSIRALMARPLTALQEEAGERAYYSIGQVFLVLLASLIALSGLVSNNPYVIIGAMLISPILGPVYAFSVSIVLGPRRRALDSAATLSTLLAVAFVAALAASIVSELAGLGVPVTRELLARTRSTGLDLAVPLLLGIASIIAVSSNTTEALAGVAIAAALVPPAATLGWLLPVDARLALGALGVLSLNVVGLLVGGSLTVFLAVGRARRV